MRGSLLAVVAIAVIAGLGAVVVARNLGLFGAAPAPTPPPPPTPTAPPNLPPVPTVVVPARNVFSSDALSPNDVRSRNMTPEELKEFISNPSAFITEPTVAHFRMPASDLEANRALRPTDLKPSSKPDYLPPRLLPGTVAVRLLLSKENSAGGLIAVDDWVDVCWQTEVSRSDSSSKELVTCVLLQRAPVIAKRDSLYPIYAALPTDDIPFMIAANPYRAALIKYASQLGTLSLVPVSQVEKKRLDALRATAAANPQPLLKYAIPFAEENGPEFKQEVERLEQFAHVPKIRTEDLTQLLNLPLLQPLTQPITIDVISGVRKTSTTTLTASNTNTTPLYYQFSRPGGVVAQDVKASTPPAKPAGSAVSPLAPPTRN